MPEVICTNCRRVITGKNKLHGLLWYGYSWETKGMEESCFITVCNSCKTRGIYSSIYKVFKVKGDNCQVRENE